VVGAYNKIAADGGRGGGIGGSRGSSKDSGRGCSGNIGANSFDINGGRQQQGPEQTAISQRAAEMAVVAAAMVAAMTEVKTVAEGAEATLALTALAMMGAGNGEGK
jgi:hypothetical protein